MAGKINSYIDSVRAEMKKVTWLSNDELVGSTGVVAVFSIVMSCFLFVADYGVSNLMSWFLGN